jgi:hypothetical protein
MILTGFKDYFPDPASGPGSVIPPIKSQIICAGYIIVKNCYMIVSSKIPRAVIWSDLNPEAHTQPFALL